MSGMTQYELAPIDLILIGVYFLVVVVIGIRLAGRNHTAEDCGDRCFSLGLCLSPFGGEIRYTQRPPRLQSGLNRQRLFERFGER